MRVNGETHLKVNRKFGMRNFRHKAKGGGSEKGDMYFKFGSSFVLFKLHHTLRKEQRQRSCRSPFSCYSVLTISAPVSDPANLIAVSF